MAKKMFTAVEALNARRASSGAGHRSELSDEALRAANIKLSDEQPDVIVGGFWPTNTIGAERALCGECGRYIALSPNSGIAASQRWPDVPVLCFRCAKNRATEGILVL